MVQYILECIAFQLVFLIIYDFFLKRETFFQWNRSYLIGTYILSMVLPWIKIEALKTTVPEQYYVYPEFLWNTNDNATTVVATESPVFNISWEEGIIYGGMLLATLYFGFKLYQIQKLRRNGSVQYFPDFTRVIVENSELAFSFFKSIFLGDKVIARDHEGIIKHELVHIEQRHSWDLLFFELMRIVGWFNPLVYVYQSRISELHEFIADAKVAKTHKREQYEFLLSQVFQTENISFVNQFFKSSLIKKRIVMLQKTKSKKILKLKYLALIPFMLGMLVYSSCEEKSLDLTNSEMVVKDIHILSAEEDKKLFDKLKELSDTGEHWEFLLKDENSAIRYQKSVNGSHIKFSNGQALQAIMAIEDNSLAEKIGDLMQEIISKDSLSEAERGALARMIYETYPNGIEGISGEKGNVVFEANKNLQKTSAKYDQLVSERNRLLASADENNPFIVNLDQQINALAKRINQESESVPFAVVEEVPIFPGCEDSENTRECFHKSIQKHISKNFNYPLEAQEKGIQGRVNVMFTISQKGTIQNVRMRGPDQLLEKEAARIIRLLPKMIPGKQKGEIVNVPFSIPITFKLQGEEDTFRLKLDLDSPKELAPHVIIDGKESTPEEMKKINPDDIASINVLKDETAIKEYGEKGKNGIIEVKMKKNNTIKLPFEISTNPIYIIDGKKSSKEELSLISPNRIESMNVLKGEAATSAYGKEAKNGAVLVILKRKE